MKNSQRATDNFCSWKFRRRAILIGDSSVTNVCASLWVYSFRNTFAAQGANFCDTLALPTELFSQLCHIFFCFTRFCPESPYRSERLIFRLFHAPRWSPGSTLTTKCHKVRKCATLMGLKPGIFRLSFWYSSKHVYCQSLLMNSFNCLDIWLKRM